MTGDLSVIELKLSALLTRLNDQDRKILLTAQDLCDRWSVSMAQLQTLLQARHLWPPATRGRGISRRWHIVTVRQLDDEIARELGAVGAPSMPATPYATGS